LTAVLDRKASPIISWLQQVFDYDGSVAQVYYPLRFLSIDVDELEEYSTWRVVMLGRYGRQSMLQWDDVPVPRIKQLTHALVELIKQENELNSAAEDG
jgi:hypothetical protein